MTDLRIEATRGDLVESVHRVSVAVVHSEGRLLASAGDASRVTYWRSAAKPFQALPLVDDGAADAFGLTPPELALACASHSSEPIHLTVAAGMLGRIGAGPDELACGPHPPLSPAVAEQVTRDGIALTPLWSNCSGKHAGMLAVCRARGWRTEGYRTSGHRMQRENLKDVAKLAGLDEDEIRTAVDGCGVVTFALPLDRMAAMFTQLESRPEGKRIADAMRAHPELIRGAKSTDTLLMKALPGAVAKGGAEGLMCGVLPDGTGFALKSVDGNQRPLRAALAMFLGPLGAELPVFETTPVMNSRGETVGDVVASTRR
jgi:L-asparaginase II